MEVLMDSFSVYGTSFNHCLHNFNKSLQRCEDTNLVLNWEKCHFMVKKGIVFGHKISGKGIEVEKSKAKAIDRLAPLRDIKGIRSFLGLAGFYRRFIKNFSKISRPLTNLMQNNVHFNFNESCLVAFSIPRKALLNAPSIKPPIWKSLLKFYVKQ
jgi:hypothetical protein